MGRPVKEGNEGDDLLNARRARDRAAKSSLRSEKRRREVISLWNRIIEIYTQDTNFAIENSTPPTSSPALPDAEEEPKPNARNRPRARRTKPAAAA